MDLFDKKISEKLESVKAETLEKDWDRFNKKFTGEKQSFSKVVFQNIYKIAATVAITSMLYIASAQYFTIKELEMQLEETKIAKNELSTQNEIYLKKITTLEEEKGQINIEKENLLENKNLEKLKNKDNKIANIKVVKPSKSTTKKKANFFMRVKSAITNIFTSKKDSSKKPISKTKPINTKKAQD